MHHVDLKKDIFSGSSQNGLICRFHTIAGVPFFPMYALLEGRNSGQQWPEGWQWGKE
jgi:hypothetical protein